MAARRRLLGRRGRREEHDRGRSGRGNEVHRAGVIADRHGGAGAGGLITVELRVSGDGLDLVVRDNGGPAPFSPGGYGSQIIEGIARELGGRINRSFARTGCCAVLSLDSVATTS